MSKPDLPDSTLRPSGGPIRSNAGRTVRSWFVGPDGLTSVERELAATKEELRNLAGWCRSIIDETIGFPLADAKEGHGPFLAAVLSAEGTA